MEIQMQMSERAIELLSLPDDQPCFILDIGCGSGLSGEALTEAGHAWVGVDISQAMLDVAVTREVEGDVCLLDMGEGLPFRAGTFDGAMSVSALQWLCNADRKEHDPRKRLYKFFSSLYACLVRGAKAVFQVYPENPDQMELITQQAMRAGFTGGVVVDYPNSTKAKKFYLCLFTGGVPLQLPKGLGTEEAHRSTAAAFIQARREFKRQGKTRVPPKSREWIELKKQRRSKQGKSVPHSSRYTGRKRFGKF